MTDRITHHPSEETLAGHAAGTIDKARGLIVEMHLACCSECQLRVAEYETIGGALLESMPGTPIKPGALEKALLLIGEDHERPQPKTAADPLDHHVLGPWRWVGPGVHRRAVTGPEVEGIRVFMLEAAPGTKLPHHRHTGYEWTCVLQGAFQHEYGRYGPGDFDEADETMEHKPTVCEGAPCICIVALQGQVLLQSRLGRLLQPLVRL